MGDKEKKAKKSKRTPEQKRRSGAIAIVTCLSIVVAISIIFSAFSAASQVSVNKLMNREYNKVTYAEERPQLNPTKDEDGFYKFTLPSKDYKFKVLQLTDIHIGGGFASSQTDVWAMNAVATMVRTEKPDLVIVTGDIAYPVPFQAGTFNNLNATRIFSEFMTRLGVYWTFTFGNHDTEVYGTHTREDIIKYYADQCAARPDTFGKYCLFNPNLEADGFSNQVIKVGYEEELKDELKVAAKDGKPAINNTFITTQALICLDSHSYHEDDKLGILWHYDSLHLNQQQWFNSQMDALKAANTENAKNCKNTVNPKDIYGSLFIHIPLEEYHDAYVLSGKLNDYVANQEYTNGETSVDKIQKVSIESGIIGEKAPYCYSGTYGCETFENCAPHGLKAVFCGHDHYNNIVMNYTKKAKDGELHTVKLCYGRSVDYLAYPGIWQWQAQRGCSRITLLIDEDGNNNIKVENQDYYSHQYDAERNEIGKDKADKYSKKVDAIPDKVIENR